MLDFDLLLKTNEHQSITTFLMSRFDNVFLLLWHLWKNTDSLPHFIFITISGIQLSWLTGIGSALVVLCSMFMIKKEFYFKDSPLTVAAIISFTMSIVYMPQLHYAHALIVVIIIFLLTQKMTNNLIPIVISCIALIRFVTVFTQFPSAQPYKDTVSLLNSVQLTSPIHILESDNVYAAYLPTLTVSRVAYRITQPLCEYISDYSINVIILNNNFITKSGFSRKEIDELNLLNSCGYHWQSLMTPMGNVLIRSSPAKH